MHACVIIRFHEQDDDGVSNPRTSLAQTSIGLANVCNDRLCRFPGAGGMPKMGQMDEVKWSVVCIPLVVFMVVTAVTFWSMATIPQQRALNLDLEAVDQGGAATIYLNIDCDVCVVVYTGDDGSAKPSKTNLPFPLVRRLFQTANKIKKPAQREKIVCVGVDNPVIPCRMARDEFGPNVNCWGFEHMYTQIPTPVSKSKSPPFLWALHSRKERVG